MGCVLAFAVKPGSGTVMRVKIEYDDRAVQKELKRLAKAAGLVNDDFVDYAASVAQNRVVKNVQPFGLTGKAKDLGEAAVWSSLRNAFKVVGNNYNGRDLVTGISEVHQLHQRARNSRGRVGHKRANRPKVKYGLFKTYGNKVIAKVGGGKGGFASKSDILKNRGIQGWVKRHSNAGSARRVGRINSVEWRFDNDKSYTKDSWVMGQSKLQSILDAQRATLKASLRGKLRRMGKL